MGQARQLRTRNQMIEHLIFLEEHMWQFMHDIIKTLVILVVLYFWMLKQPLVGLFTLVIACVAPMLKRKLCYRVSSNEIKMKINIIIICTDTTIVLTNNHKKNTETIWGKSFQSKYQVRLCKSSQIKKIIAHKFVVVFFLNLRNRSFVQSGKPTSWHCKFNNLI